MPTSGSTLLAFNTVERLLKGDFFHTVTLGDVAGELGALPAHWPLVGLGTTNWRERHGELFVEGTAGTGARAPPTCSPTTTPTIGCGPSVGPSTGSWCAPRAPTC